MMQPPIHAPYLAATITLALSAAAAADGPRIVNLGAPPGYAWSSVHGISADGAHAIFGPFRWSDQGWQDIGSAGLCTGEFSGPALLGISADGTIAAGSEQTPLECSRGFRWTAAGGIEDLGTLPGGGYHTSANAISADGRVIVGYATANPGAVRPVRWTQAGGIEVIGESGGPARAVSADGAAIAGGRLGGIAWRWMAATGQEFVAHLPGATRGCIATAISADGTTIAGHCSAIAQQHWPFKWSEVAGTIPLEYQPQWHNIEIYALSGDGGLAIGRYHTTASGYRAAIWIGEQLVDLNDHLEALGVNLDGWILREARAMNADATVIAGGGTYVGESRGWIAYLSSDCYANCDGSTIEPILNVDDFTCFINEFALALNLPPAQQSTSYANCDGSTTAPVLNVDDFTCFINAFAAGCP